MNEPVDLFAPEISERIDATISAFPNAVQWSQDDVIAVMSSDSVHIYCLTEPEEGTQIGQNTGLRCRITHEEASIERSKQVNGGNAMTSNDVFLSECLAGEKKCISKAICHFMTS